MEVFKGGLLRFLGGLEGRGERTEYMIHIYMSISLLSLRAI